MSDSVANRETAYDLIRRLDCLSGILQPSLGRWLAWPAVRMQLLWSLQYQATSGARPSRLRRYLGRLRAALAGIGRPGSPCIAFLGNAKIYHTPDGEVREGNFDDLARGAGLSHPAILLHYPWPGAETSNPSLPYASSLARPLLCADALALFLYFSPRIRSAANELAGLVAAASDAWPPMQLRRRSRLALAMFESRRRVFRHLFRRLNAVAVVTTYAPGHMGEVAAASELGLPVVEIQHGIFGPACADYHWPESYRGVRDRLPLAAHIGVCGPVFADFITRSGYWQKEQVTPVGLAAIDRFARVRKRAAGRGMRRLLFMTQITSRTAAAAFISDLIKVARATGADIELAIKIHPEEQSDFTFYRKLEEAGRVHILPTERTAFEAMMAADLVLSFSSFALLEAVGLGIPAVSIRGEGPSFGELFGLREIKDNVVHEVDRPEQLLDLLRHLSDPANAAAWEQSAESLGRQLFTPDFLENAARLVNRISAS